MCLTLYLITLLFYEKFVININKPWIYTNVSLCVKEEEWHYVAFALGSMHLRHFTTKEVALFTQSTQPDDASPHYLIEQQVAGLTRSRAAVQGSAESFPLLFRPWVASKMSAADSPKGRQATGQPARAWGGMPVAAPEFSRGATSPLLLLHGPISAVALPKGCQV